MDVGYSLWGFEASTMTLQHHSLDVGTVKGPPYVHPQHIKVLKHFLLIMEMQQTRSWALDKIRIGLGQIMCFSYRDDMGKFYNGVREQ